MGLRFVVEEGVTDPGNQGTFFVLQRTRLPADGTGMLRPQLERLLLGRCFERPGKQGLDGDHGDVFHLSEVDVESGPVLAPVLPDDNSSPPLGQFLDTAKVLRSRFACSHLHPCKDLGI
jgi:hypothetical protein